MVYNDLLLLPGCVLLCAKPASGAMLPLLARRFAQIWLGWALLCVPVAVLVDALRPASLIGEKLVFMNPFFGTAVTLFLLLNPPAWREAAAMEPVAAAEPASR
jgi:hypothetical protein